MNEKLIALQHFFTVDQKIKQEMNKICPPSNNGYLDESSIIQYLDLVFDSLDYIFMELKCITKDFINLPFVFEKINQLESLTKNAFIFSKTDINKLRQAYEMLISNMSEEFLNSTKAECKGYYAFNGINKPLSHVNTINEMLHLLHAYILNSDFILQAVPEISRKEQNGCEISLRGKSVPYFNQLFQEFPIEITESWTDMVVVSEDKLIMMIRDRGHALSIEITLNQNIARIEYFIPKLCNIEMINRLPGINPVHENSIGATGVIEVEKSNLSTVLFDFISNVPTDNDIIESIQK